MLRNAVLSVVRQTFHDRRIIIVDDGSTDDTNANIKDLLEKYRFIKYYQNQCNEGVSKARNTGILFSRESKYIAFLDSDDIWKKRKLEIQIGQMVQKGHLISYTNEDWIKDGKYKNQSKAHHKFTGDIFANSLKLCMVSPSSVVFERKVFDKIGYFDENLKVAEDYDLFIRASIYYDFLFIDKNLVIKHGGHSDQLSVSRQVLDSFRVRSLEKVYNNYFDDLSRDRISLLKKEILIKSEIISKGAFKRMRNKFGMYYLIKAMKYGLLS